MVRQLTVRRRPTAARPRLRRWSTQTTRTIYTGAKCIKVKITPLSLAAMSDDSACTTVALACYADDSVGRNLSTLHTINSEAVKLYLMPAIPSSSSYIYYSVMHNYIFFSAHRYLHVYDVLLACRYETLCQQV